MESEATTQLAQDSGDPATRPINKDSTAVGRMLYALTQRLPQLNSRPFYADVNQAEREGLWPVTHILRVPLIKGGSDDMNFLGRVAEDLDREPAGWVLVLEYLSGYPGVSVWRTPSKLTKAENQP